MRGEDKVYCCKCTWSYDRRTCCAPQNRLHKNFWRQKMWKKPKELNAFNDCEWYEKIKK